MATISEIIDRVDATRPNAYSDGEKKRWLSQLDSMAWRDVISTHEPAEGEDEPEPFEGYDDDTDPDTTELLIPDEYQELYITWMYAKIDFANQETARYNNSMAMFNAMWQDYAASWNRTHMPRRRYIRGAGGRIWR